MDGRPGRFALPLPSDETQACRRFGGAGRRGGRGCGLHRRRPGPRVPPADCRRRDGAWPAGRPASPSRPSAAPSRSSPTRCSPISSGARPTDGMATSRPPFATCETRPSSTRRPRDRSSSSATCSLALNRPDRAAERYAAYVAARRPVAARALQARARPVSRGPADARPALGPPRARARRSARRRRTTWRACAWPRKARPPRPARRSSAPSTCSRRSCPPAKRWPPRIDAADVTSMPPSSSRRWPRWIAAVPPG